MLHLQGQHLKVTAKKVCITSGIFKTCGIENFLFSISLWTRYKADFPDNLCREMVAYIANTLIFILR